jgi:hypothetical protein
VRKFFVFLELLYEFLIIIFFVSFRLKGKDLSSEMISSAFNRFFNIYKDGFPSLFHIIRKNDVHFSYDLQQEFQLEKENKNLLEEISNFFIVLSSSSSVYNSILLKEMIPTILQEILKGSAATDKRKKLLLSLLSKMVCANDDIVLLEFLFEFFQKNFFATNMESGLSSEKLTVFNEMMELFAKIMKSDSVPAEKKASFKVKLIFYLVICLF